MPVGCATVLAAWVLHLQGQGAPLKDPGAEAARAAAAATDRVAAVSGVLDTLADGLSADRELVERGCPAGRDQRPALRRPCALSLLYAP